MCGMQIPSDVLEREELPLCFNNWMRGTDIDPKIWPLVRILNLKGIQTTSSCEGHYVLSWENHAFPWVRFETNMYSDEKQEGIVKKLRDSLRKYNSKLDIHWDVVQKDLRVGINAYNFIQPISVAPVSILQDTIPDLVDYIRNEV
jgi:hypothetical protein